MSGIHFNLLDDPWIALSRLDGSQATLGIREVLHSAHELAEISGDPPVVASVSRLLVAIVHRVLDGPATPAAWGDAFAAGRFDPAAVDHYLCKHAERFELFHPEQPFFQARLPHGAFRTVAQIDPAAASGHNTTLFDHSRDDRPAPMEPGEAARRLVALQSFAAGGRMSGEAGGGVSGNAAMLSGSWVFLADGPSLFHTLLLNTPLYDPEAGRPFPALGPDVPVWERPSPLGAAVRSPAGWLDLLTYPARRIELLAEVGSDGPVVTAAAITDGDRAAGGWALRGREQALAFRQTKASGWIPLRPSEGRDLWRDSTVFLATGTEESEPPRIIEHVAMMVAKGHVPIDLRIGLHGLALATNQAKFLTFDHQRLPLRASLLVTDRAGELVAGATAAAEKVAGILQRAIAELAGRSADNRRDPDERRRRREWGERVMAAYWSSLPVAFDHFLAAIDADTGALRSWAGALEAAARRAWTPWIRTVPSGNEGFRRIASAERIFASALAVPRQLREEAR